MQALDLFRFSAGALRGHRLRTGLSLTGVAIGVASVILLTSLGEGARLYVVGEFASLGSNLVIVVPGRTETRGMAPFVSGAPHDLTLEDARAVAQRVQGVRRAAPVALGTGPVSHGSRTRTVPVVGTTAEFLAVRRLELAGGRFLPGGEAGERGRVCVIGTKVREELFPGQNPLGETIQVAEHRFRVIGVMAPTGTSIGMNVDDMVYVPVRTAMRIFNRSSLFRVLIEANSYAEIDRVADAARALLTERHGEEDVTILTQDSVLSTFGEILTMLTAALAGIAAISLGVAGIGIMNVMLVTVVERTREIGLLKALGVTRPQIVSAFLVEAAIISTTGGLAGLAIALIVSRTTGHFFPDFPIRAPEWAVAAAIAVSMLVGVVFGALPARRAARLDPVAALARR